MQCNYLFVQQIFFSKHLLCSEGEILWEFVMEDGSSFRKRNPKDISDLEEIILFTLPWTDLVKSTPYSLNVPGKRISTTALVSWASPHVPSLLKDPSQRSLLLWDDGTPDWLSWRKKVIEIGELSRERGRLNYLVFAGISREAGVKNDIPEPFFHLRNPSQQRAPVHRRGLGVRGQIRALTRSEKRLIRKGVRS